MADLTSVTDPIDKKLDYLGDYRSQNSLNTPQKTKNLSHTRVLTTLFLTVVCSLWVSGCARTVTDKSSLLQIEIEIGLRGPLETGDYVAVAFSSTAPPTMPSGSDHIYFPLPGQTLDTSLMTTPIENYYSSYFESWSDYLLCQVGGPSFYASGSTGFSITATDNANIAPKTTFQVTHNFQSSTATLKLSFFVGEIASASTGDTLYITMMTTRHDPTQSSLSEGASGYFQDVLLSPIAISLRADQEIQKLPNQEGIDTTLPPAADIQAWRVSIF